jgi:hypothetical protein
MTNSESEKFDAVVRKVLSVSHSELQRREKEWKRKRAANKKVKGLHDNRNKNNNTAK